MQKLFVTGATGVLGRRAVPLLLAAGHHVTAVARSDAKAAKLTTAGATPVDVDLFDADAVAEALSGADAVVHLATHIPTGAALARKRSWRTNDRLRTEGASNLVTAALDAGITRYVGESITFPYTDGGDAWIDETHPQAYDFATGTSAAAEDAARRVTDAGGHGVSLRFAMFHAADSAHVATYLGTARRGFSPFLGDRSGYTSFIDSGDAGSAIVAALDAPAGIYNVAETDPLRRSDHEAALAEAVGRSRLRPTPGVVQRMAGESVETFARSQRISSAKLQEATGWTPRVTVVERWKDLA